MAKEFVFWKFKLTGKMFSDGGLPSGGVPSGKPFFGLMVQQPTGKFKLSLTGSAPGSKSFDFC